MAEPNVMDLKDCEVLWIDGDGTELAVEMDEGNLTWTEAYENEYKTNRGLLATGTVRKGNEQPMSISISGRFSKYTSDVGEATSIPDFIKGKHGGTSSDASRLCAPFACDLVVRRTNQCTTSVTTLDEIITFPDFRVDEIGGDFQAGQFNLTGRCMAEEPTSIGTDLTP